MLREACLRFLIKAIVFILCYVEKNILKIFQKLPVFSYKIKTKPYIKNVRQASLEENVVILLKKIADQ